jgi:hypothetical protein
MADHRGDGSVSTDGHSFAENGRMDEPMPTPFRFSIGVPFDHGSFTSVGGDIRWGDGGWLVSNGTLDYQAPGHMGQTEALIEWLRRFFQVQQSDGGSDAR